MVIGILGVALSIVIVMLARLAPLSRLPISRTSTLMKEFSKRATSSEISREELASQTTKDLMKNDELRLLDVRERVELEKSGNISSALNVPMSELESAFAMTEAGFKKQYGNEKPLQDQELVTFCAKGVRAAIAQQILVSKFDFTRVRAFKGDFEDLKHAL